MSVNKGAIVFHTCNYLFFLLFAFICIYPFYYIFLYSISDTTKVSSSILSVLPKGFTLANYSRVLLNKGISDAFVISVLRTVIGTLLTVVCCSIFAYALTKRELPFRKLVYRLTVASMYFSAGLIPLYMLYKQVGLLNNFLVYVIPSAVSAYYLILIKTYIEQIPPALEESAMVDGANYFVIFTKIVLPLSVPIIATIALFSAVGQWNMFYDNLIYVSDPRLETLQLQLYRVLDNFTEAFQNVSTKDLVNIVKPTPTTVRMTITMITTLPILFLYPFMQRYFLKGIMLGAVKG